MIINGNLDLSESSIESLGNIKEIRGFLNLLICNNLKDLGSIEKIQKDFKISWSEINSTSNLEKIGGDCEILRCSKLTTLNKLKKVSGVINLFKCENLTSLGNLEIIDGQFLSLQYCKNLKDFGKISLQSGNFDIYLKSSGITKEYVEKFKPELMDKCIWR